LLSLSERANEPSAAAAIAARPQRAPLKRFSPERFSGAGIQACVDMATETGVHLRVVQRTAGPRKKSKEPYQ
jgi:hypothetical protein